MHPAASFRLCEIQVRLGALIVLLAGGWGHAAEPALKTPPPPAPATHVLFMGVNLATEKDKAFHLIEDVTGTSLVIKQAGKPVNVAWTRGSDVQVTETLKLTDRNVTLEGFEATRAYAVGSDPFDQVAQAASLAAGESAVTELVQFEAAQANLGVAQAYNQLEPVRGTPGEAVAQAVVTQAVALQAAADAASVRQFETRPLADPGARAASIGAGDRYDAIRIKFKVTADRAMARPYYAAIATIREPGSKPGQVRKWVHVKPLAPLSAGVPVTVNVYQGGFTSGYILEGCQVHLFDGGEELATNLSRKRVPLSDDEALEYRIIEYIGANKGRTLPAVIATPTLGGEARAGLTAEQLDQPCHVRVDRNGRVVAVFSDAAARRPLSDPALESALKTLRFKPALVDGKPVESTPVIKLAELSPGRASRP